MAEKFPYPDVLERIATDTEQEGDRDLLFNWLVDNGYMEPVHPIVWNKKELLEYFQ